MEERLWICRAKKKGRQKKKVKFTDDEPEDETDKGGAIRNPKAKETVTDVRRIEMSEGLMPEYDVGYETDTDSEDEETGAYSHLGGRLSGRGMAYDDPDVAQAMIKTFQGYPELLHTYTSGRVANPPGTRLDGFQRFAAQDAGASVIDYGGSMPGISHVENGYLTAHDSAFPHEFHII